MAEQSIRVDDGFAGRGDDFYEALIRAHQGLSEAESHTLNARLVLILANHIGDQGTARSARAGAPQPRAALIRGRGRGTVRRQLSPQRGSRRRARV